MKKRNILAITALLITLLLTFVGCAEKTKPLPEGEGGSDIAATEPTEIITVVETTAAPVSTTAAAQ